MKYVGLVLVGVCALPPVGFAQEPIYRCGNEYTNTVPDAKAQGCQRMDGGNVTTVQGTRPAASAPVKPPTLVPPSLGQRVETGEQKSRDADARQILQTELHKTELRQVDLLKEYKQGAPEQRADETPNSPKYLARVNALKASLARGESDLASLRRELSRLSSIVAQPPSK